MSTVSYSPRAERNIQAIRRRLEREAGLQTALKWVQRLRGAARALSEFPGQGAIDPDIKRRRVVVRPYLVFYDVTSNGDILVTAVVDGQRDLPSAFGDNDAV